MDDFLLVVATGSFFVVLGIQIHRFRRDLRSLIAAVESRRPGLLAQGGGVRSWLGLEGLREAVNQLLRENELRRQSERTSVEQIRTTLGSLREAVFMIDADNFLVMANDAVASLLPSGESPVGRRLEAVFQGSEFFEYVGQIKRDGEAGLRVMRVMIGRKKRWFEITGTRLPEIDPHGRPFLLFVLHDITRQKQLERVRTEFVANVSHELRTPVTIIKGFTETLIDDHASLDSAEQLHFLGRIQKNVTRLNQMLEELLMLSRLESDPDAMRFELRSLGRLVRETVDNFGPRMADRPEKVEVVLGEGDDRLLLDPLRMSQVLENLFENVLRHAKGFKILRIETAVGEEGVSCAVIDDGIGVPEKDLPHLFERFYRVDKGRSRESGGTGLGLSIVKHIIQQHNGEISAHRRASGGSRIEFFLPFPGRMQGQSLMSFVEPNRRSLDGAKGNEDGE